MASRRRIRRAFAHATAAVWSRARPDRYVDRLAGSTDPLTGVGSHSALERALETEIARLASAGGCSWLLVVDLDGFKEINDRLGHGGGDEVLAAIAGRLERLSKRRGPLARIGGDEFALLVREPLTSEQLTGLIGELERTAVAPLVVAGHNCHVTITVGAAAVHASGTPDDVLRLADERMYLAKRRSGSDPFDRVSELIVGLLEPDAGIERALASGVAEVAEAETVYVSYPGGEQWWPAEPRPDRAALLRMLTAAARGAGELLDHGEWLLAAPLRGDGVPIGAFAVERARPFAKPDRIALARTGVALGQALLRLSEGIAARSRISELEQLAFRDENTGLANRRALLAELQRLEGSTEPLTLLFLDFDGLRAVNNKLSYEHGNELLRTVAGAIERMLRPGELAARLHGSGGDEFIVVAPGVDAATAATRARELERGLAAVELPLPVAELYGGASVGFALRVPGEPALELVERAAALMRHRKRLRKEIGDVG